HGQRGKAVGTADAGGAAVAREGQDAVSEQGAVVRGQQCRADRPGCPVGGPKVDPPVGRAGPADGGQQARPGHPPGRSRRSASLSLDISANSEAKRSPSSSPLFFSPLLSLLPLGILSRIALDATDPHEEPCPLPESSLPLISAPRVVAASSDCSTAAGWRST